MKKFLIGLTAVLILTAGCKKDEQDELPTIQEVIANRWNIKTQTVKKDYHTYWQGDYEPESNSSNTQTYSNVGQYQLNDDQTGFYLNANAQKDDFAWILYNNKLTINYDNFFLTEEITITLVDSETMNWSFKATQQTSSTPNATPPNGAVVYSYTTTTTKVDATVEKL